MKYEESNLIELKRSLTDDMKTEVIAFLNSYLGGTIYVGVNDDGSLYNYTQEEKEADPKKESIGGYLKTYTAEEAWANWWDKLNDENREIIKEIPNFDAEIFKDITGIEVEK